MNIQQAKTAKRLLPLGLSVVVQIAYMAWVEYAGVAQGGDSSISTIMRLAWIHQPGAILVLCVLLALCGGILISHFWWAGSAAYEDLDRKEREGQ
jgi:hypothetical protein